MLDINRIYCGDNVTLCKQLDDNCIDLTVTSPPYDNLRKYKGFTWDFKALAKELCRVTKPGGVIVWVVGDATVNGSETGTSFRQALYFNDIGLSLWDTMIYEKSGMSYPGSNKRYYQTFEYMFVFSNGQPKSANLIKDRKNKYVGIMGGNHRGGLCKRREYGCRFNVWRYNNGKYNSTKDNIAFKHEAIMPEQLASDHIISWSNENDLILDPFMGSGTTAKCAKLLKRNYIGFEISEEYCKIAEERLQKC